MKYVIVKAVARFGSIFNHKRAGIHSHKRRGEKAAGKMDETSKTTLGKRQAGQQAGSQVSLKIDAQMTVTILFNWF